MRWDRITGVILVDLPSARCCVECGAVAMFKPNAVLGPLQCCLLTSRGRRKSLHYEILAENLRICNAGELL